MFIRQSTLEDLPRLLEIYQSARAFMAQSGNPNQWRDYWPPRELIEKDIAAGHSYVCEDNGRIVGTFFFDAGRDIEPTYAVIYGGKWKDDGAYGVIHRIARDGSAKGVGAYCINWCYEQCKHLRIDTHPDNKVMRNLLVRLGFVHCGTIYVVQDPAPRLAFEKTAFH